MIDTRRGIQDAAHMLESYQSEGRADEFYRELGEILPTVDRHRISVRTLFEEFVEDGAELVRHMAPGYRADGTTALMEAGDAVDTGNFSNVIGQITYSSVLDRLDAPEFIARDLVTTVPATTQEVEIIPGVSLIGDVAEDVGEGKEYPRVGVSEEYVTAPRKVKDGFILELTEEVIWEDKTGLLMQRANTATEALGITWEREVLDTVLGVTTSYSRNGGAAQATYGDTHTEGDFDNLSATTGLEDWTDIEAALLLFDAITDPNTGDPVFVGGPLQVVVPSALRATLMRILSATETREVTNTNTTTISGNPLTAQIAGRIGGQMYEGYSGPFVNDRTSSTTTWFIGNFRAAFEYREVWPIQVFRSDRNSHMGFTRDVVTAIKVRRKGAPAVVEPRKVVKCTA